MNKIKNLSESSFLKLFFAFFSAAFLIGAVCMPDRATMFSGLWAILASPAKVTTNYFSLGGYAGTFLNMGLLALVMTLLFTLTKDFVREGQIVIDVSMNWNPEKITTKGKGGMSGDCVFEEVEPIVEAITPVPGGVGAVTTSVLMKHVVEAAEKI